ncbi:glycoside hydrolase family 35 protein [Microbacterium sp. Root180]|uniref:glycoside hydrolase family 35 protein n=1 Tax=Microbacterium sp. Root180 TaxID=1736483 RepID=UPI0006F2B5B0|nr:beta-galactosidase family protein [Microbacterium sp. Root180]KRB35180.1 beta-galactosidase [Microbacterium sp. Root180]
MRGVDDASANGRSFTIGDTDFLLDGEPFRVLSGAIHYFRVHPDQWADRIRKARLMGLNSIETYVAWNAHEPIRGEWDASGWNDLGAFLDAVAEEGLYAIVRPGPYICAEWANGGLPVWLTADDGIRLRSSERGYLAEASRFLRRVYEIVGPRQIHRGGNVVLVQIENEYGAYGADKDYLEALVAVTRDAGITVPLTTVDQPQPQMLRDGSVPGVHLTGSFGSRASERLATLREFQPTGPLMCMEFWDGWFDRWGGHHHTTDPAEAAAELESMLAAGASVNFYMFHGGTNFGLTNGANDNGRYHPIVTSYDYDGPLDEAGSPTAKYFAFREVIARYASVPDELPATGSPSPQVTVELHPAGDWMPVAGESGTRSDSPPTFDELGFDGALVRYEVDLPEMTSPQLLEFGEVRDLAWVRVDDGPPQRLSRRSNDRAVAVAPGRLLTVLVEDQGRVNYASHIGEPKGLIGSVHLGGQPLQGWRATTIDVESMARQVQVDDCRTADEATQSPVVGPVALSGGFVLEERSDLFLDTTGWAKGFAFVNGFHLGRYWSEGPQRTLYVPAPVTRAGSNHLVILELEHVAAATAHFRHSPLLGYRDE